MIAYAQFQIRSKKCLDESGWDYSRAIAAFREALQQSLVPAEAFSS